MGVKGKELYPRADIELGLHVMAECAGSANRAVIRLEKQHGKKIPQSTLQSWKNKTHAERYAQINKEVTDRLFNAISRHQQQLSVEATKDAHRAVLKAKQATKEGDSKEAKAWAATAKDLVITSGISFEKASVAEGRPTEITQSQSLPQILQSLAARFPTVVRPVALESTATEEEAK